MDIVPVDLIPQVTYDVPDDPIEVLKVCKQMEQVCSANLGMGLSAVQIGLPWKLFIINDNHKFRYMVNCEYEPVGAETVATVEGCLSLPGRFFRVNRWRKVIVSGLELVIDQGEVSFKEFHQSMFDGSKEFGKLEHAVYQHEIDHHRGILISDIGKELSIRFLANRKKE